ncbi:MAG: amidohydrolase family protein [Synechococcaceae cyanobacterium]|nr:amidohydrolase family protein [Synechococcaceae cyanobacterium]
MPAASELLPPLRIPRVLLDPRHSGLPGADDDGLVAVRLEHADGLLRAIHPLQLPPDQPVPLALTPLVEPHAHLDKAFTAQQFPNREGTLEGAMAANLLEARERRGEDVQRRAAAALERGWRQGLRAIRSHVDGIGPWFEPSWQVLAALRRQWRGRLELQLVAMVPVSHWLTPEGRALAGRVAADGGLLGGVLGPPFAPDRRDGEALLALLQLAERHGCGIDLHVDESAAAHGRGVGLVTHLLLHHRIDVPLTCSHASSMGLKRHRPCQRLAERMAAAGVSVVALPTTNLWLLGREALRTPKQRVQAPIRQLQSAGVCVALGGDNVQDPWFPGGDFDPLALMRFAMVASHVVPWQREGLSPYTTAPSQLMALDWDGVLRVGGPADLLVLGASDWITLQARAPQRRVLRAGRWLPPPQTETPSPLLAGLGG